MRLLIDECIDERLRLHFPAHECATVRFAGLQGLKNGRLLTAAEEAGYEVLVTVDRGIPAQQNYDGPQDRDPGAVRSHKSSLRLARACSAREQCAALDPARPSAAA